ncbi:hypothetical protein K458DRAFT_396962 [Lentithecium fluviatile CBS 122367]|uniref:Uncharacterized protein n=1 Tax=Lentithecium fluviatile CBS 122367 TaxID=1168545 RepID=A0A6G1IDS5_9PLEO|nr:hypothetical protein K458DRAFT_396962 [Lentithecium fluviatile CBS 122367]
MDDAAKLLASESTSNTYTASSAFEEAIHRQSETQLEHLLQTSGTTWDSSSLASGDRSLEHLLSDLSLLVRRNASHFETWTEDEQREFFSALAQALAERKSNCQKEEANELDSLYHVDGINLCAAICLWNAGFREVDLVGSDPWNRHLHGTPLWTHSRGNHYTADLALLKWFVARGARLDWHHPQFGTTARNELSAAIAYYHQEEEADFDEELANQVLWSDFRDKCTCLCSEGGCVAAVKMNAWTVLVDAGKVQDDDPLRQTLNLALLRMKVFQDFGLTHTCGNRDKYSTEVVEGHFPPSDEEIDDIHHIEAKDIESFLSVLHELNGKIQDYDGTLWEFLEEVGYPHLDEVRSKIPPLDQEVVQELGIKLLEPAESEEWSQGSDYDVN